MTVTKQQQLEWLAKEFDVWPGFGGVPIRMSSVATWEVNNGLGVAHYIRMEEWQQERDKMSSKPEVDNSWHERGEFPPVGCECYIRHSWNSEKYEKVTVAAITNEYLIVKYATFEQHYMLKDISFRPLRTERENAIDEMVYEFIDHHGDPKGGERYLKMATKLYDAGYRKVKP